RSAPFVGIPSDAAILAFSAFLERLAVESMAPLMPAAESHQARNVIRAVSKLALHLDHDLWVWSLDHVFRVVRSCSASPHVDVIQAHRIRCILGYLHIR